MNALFCRDYNFALPQKLQQRENYEKQFTKIHKMANDSFKFLFCQNHIDMSLKYVIITLTDRTNCTSGASKALACNCFWNLAF